MEATPGTPVSRPSHRGCGPWHAFLHCSASFLCFSQLCAPSKPWSGSGHDRHPDQTLHSTTPPLLLLLVGSAFCISSRKLVGLDSFCILGAQMPMATSTRDAGLAEGQQVLWVQVLPSELGVVALIVSSTPVEGIE